MHKFHLTLALLAALTVAGCVSTGGSSDDSTAVASLSDSGRSGAKMSDSDMVSAIQDAFKQDAQLAGINVSANQGVVTLSGSVPSAQAYNRAISVARSVTGRPPVATSLKF